MEFGHNLYNSCEFFEFCVRGKGERRYNDILFNQDFAQLQKFSDILLTNCFAYNLFTIWLITMRASLDTISGLSVATRKNSLEIEPVLE